MSVTKMVTKTINVQITANYLAEAFMDLLFFNKNVPQIKISMKRIGDVPGKNVHITCSGRGALRGSVVDGEFHGVIRGTEKQVRAWQRFFDRFISVPEFSLLNYIEWLKSENNNNHA